MWITIGIVAVLLLWTFLAIRSIRKNKKNGCTGCGGSCSGCAYSLDAINKKK
jgi:hypothetical protein